MAKQHQTDRGEIAMMWEGKNNTYWMQLRRWIGTGYVYSDYQVDKNTYTAYKDDYDLY